MEVSKIESRILRNTFTILFIVNTVCYVGIIAFLIGYSLIK